MKIITEVSEGFIKGMQPSFQSQHLISASWSCCCLLPPDSLVCSNGYSPAFQPSQWLSPTAASSRFLCAAAQSAVKEKQVTVVKDWPANTTSPCSHEKKEVAHGQGL